MSLLGCRLQVLPSLGLSVLLLACLVENGDFQVVVTYTINPSSRKTKTSASTDVLGQPSLHSQFQDGQGKSGVASGSEASVTTESLSPTPSPVPENSRWDLIRDRVMEVVTRTRDRWQWFWGPGAVQGFVQTYYEDHLKDLGPRTQAWLQSSRDHLLNKTLSLCPQLLCRDRIQG